MKKYINITFCAALIVFFGGCSKKGCTNDKADNYDSEAKKDDNTCTYSSTVYLWWNELTSDNFFDDDIKDLFIEIDGYNEGSVLDADVKYWTLADQDCENNSSNMFKKDITLESSSNKTITIRVIDQTGYEVYNQTRVVEPRVCHWYEIIYP